MENTANHPSSSAFSEAEKEQLAAIIREENKVLLREFVALKPLLSVDDLAKTLSVSKRTVETLIHAGEIQPIWIRGRRVFHPDAVDAFIRSRTKKCRK